LIARDLAALVRVWSPTGDERAALEWLAARARELGLVPSLVEHDLAGVRAAPGWPGEEAPRSELLTLEVRRADAPAAPERRLALCGHLDVVGLGGEAWSREQGAVDDGFVWGRGSADMKGGVVAALHALAAARPADGVEAVLLAVSSEEDGGQGAFAALERDARFDGCVISEPTAFDVVCAQAGALTFSGVVHGRAAHAAVRLEGRSAIDDYVPLHAAIADHERELNMDVAHPLMRELPLPYPVSVGRLTSGEWSSSVPDRLEFEGRLGVRVGETPAAARAAFEERLGMTLSWTGGQFASAETPVDSALARLALEAAGPGSRAVGVPYGADMRHFTARGIPCVMLGTSGLEVAHAVDERVSIAEVERLAAALRTVVELF
jgi:acetylornithine deacetylase